MVGNAYKHNQYTAGMLAKQPKPKAKVDDEMQPHVVSCSDDNASSTPKSLQEEVDDERFDDHE